MGGLFSLCMKQEIAFPCFMHRLDARKSAGEVQMRRFVAEVTHRPDEEIGPPSYAHRLAKEIDLQEKQDLVDDLLFLIFINLEVKEKYIQDEVFKVFKPSDRVLDWFIISLAKRVSRHRGPCDIDSIKQFISGLTWPEARYMILQQKHRKI